MFHRLDCRTLDGGFVWMRFSFTHFRFVWHALLWILRSGQYIKAMGLLKLQGAAVNKLM